MIRKQINFKWVKDEFRPVLRGLAFYKRYGSSVNAKRLVVYMEKEDISMIKDEYSQTFYEKFVDFRPALSSSNIDRSSG